LEDIDIEVEEKTNADSTHPHIRQNLGFMHTQEHFNGLKLNDYRIPYDQIDTIMSPYRHSFIYYRKLFLTFDSHPRHSELTTKTFLINAL